MHHMELADDLAWILMIGIAIHAAAFAMWKFAPRSPSGKDGNPDYDYDADPDEFRWGRGKSD